MSLIQLLVFLVVVGIAWHFLSPHVAQPFNQIIVVVAVVAFCLWLLSAFGIVSVPFRLT